MTAGLEIDGIHVSYGDLRVLEGVTLSVDSGRLLGLVGPNGAGKTTLLRAINGAVRPDAGTIDVAGVDTTSLGARALGRRVATVPQGAEVAFDFDVRDVVAMGRTPHRSRFATSSHEDHEAVQQALERADVAYLAGRSVGAISGGERQRVLLARALAQTTPVLLLDEPTASLDIHHQVRTFELVRGLVDEGKTVVAAIHDLDLAARYCDEVAVLANGEIRARGPPEEVLTPETLGDAFGARAAVTTDHVTGAPAVTALPGDPDADGALHRDGGPRVHVVGGGRPGARAIARLASAGCICSAGVLPEGDIAAETTEALGLTAVTTSAFTPPDEQAVATARNLAHDADVTVVTGDPADENLTVVRASRALVVIDAEVRERLNREARVAPPDALIETVGALATDD